MTSAERDRAVNYLIETKAALLGATRELTDEQWRRKPLPEAWSIAENVDHLAIVENGLLRALQKMASAPAAPEDQLALAAGKEDLIVRAVPSRGRKVKGPPEAAPRGEYSDPAALVTRFCEIRERTIVYASTTADPLRTRLIPHFVFGPLDGFQWLIFFAAHTERHRQQIEEVKAGFSCGERTIGA